jgi:hypothetical protein
MMYCRPLIVISSLRRTILFSPFIPFIVLFCFVMESSSMEDLRSTEHFMSSLKPFRSVSSHADKLYQLCKVLYDLAEAYVRARATAMDSDDSTSGRAPHNGGELIETNSAMHLEWSSLLVGKAGHSYSATRRQGSAVPQLPYSDLFSDYMNMMDMSDYTHGCDR